MANRLPKSPETRAKMSDAAKRRYADPAERQAQANRAKSAKGYHGLTKTGAYVSWYAMKQRCGNPRSKSYSRYGGRGISVDASWQSDFLQFLTDMGPRPDGTSLDRIDNSRGYVPGNCRWATPTEQANNKRHPAPADADRRTQTCPVCGALPGKFCTRANGERRTRVHVERFSDGKTRRWTGQPDGAPPIPES